jgi:hypothetical protein
VIDDDDTAPTYFDDRTGRMRVALEYRRIRQRDARVRALVMVLFGDANYRGRR